MVATLESKHPLLSCESKKGGDNYSSESFLLLPNESGLRSDSENVYPRPLESKHGFDHDNNMELTKSFLLLPTKGCGRTVIDGYNPFDSKHGSAVKK